MREFKLNFAAIVNYLAHIDMELTERQIAEINKYEKEDGGEQEMSPHVFELRA